MIPTLLQLDESSLIQVAWAPRASLTTYTEWCEYAQSWLAKSYGKKLRSKLSVTTSPRVLKKHAPDPTYQTLCACQRAINHMSKEETPTREQSQSLMRKMQKLGLTYTTLEESRDEISCAITDYLNQSQKRALDDWKKKAMKWSVSSQQLYRYIKNPSPAKAFALKGQFGVNSVPSKMASLLSHFWGAIESWPRGTDLDRVLMDTENLFGMFLPFCHEQIQLTAPKLRNALLGMANSTAGPDGWSISELRALPMPALESLVEVVNSPHGILLLPCLRFSRESLLRRPREFHWCLKSDPMTSSRVLHVPSLKPTPKYLCVGRARSSIARNMLRMVVQFPPLQGYPYTQSWS